MGKQTPSNLNFPALVFMIITTLTSLFLLHRAEWDSPWLRIITYLGLGITLTFWIILLRGNELTLTYPLLGLFFILIPLANRILWGDPLDSSYGIGTILILSGIILLENPYKEREV